VIPLLLSAAAGEIPCFKVYGTDYATEDGSCIRDYVHVTDLADAHVVALAKLNNMQKIKLNLGTNTGVSVLELIDAAKRVTGHIFLVEYHARRTGDPPVLVGSNEQAARVLGWVPRYSGIDAIIETAWKWKKANPKGYEHLES
jgi:UDP-glucose 4-epimerase